MVRRQGQLLTELIGLKLLTMALPLAAALLLASPTEAQVGFFSPNGSRVIANGGRNHGQFSYQRPDGGRADGAFRNHGQGNFAASGSYQTPGNTRYGGSLSRNGNSTQLGGQYRRPGILPGTQERYNGGINFQGRNTTAQWGGELYDATGRYRLGGNQMQLDRRQYQQHQDARLGGIRSNTTSNLNFRGSNPVFQSNQGVNLGGLAQTSNNLRISPRGASAGAGLNVRGATMGARGSISGRGVNMRATMPTMQMPRAPQVSTPTLTTPRVSTPRVQLPSPRISVPTPQPRISLPRVRF